MPLPRLTHYYIGYVVYHLIHKVEPIIALVYHMIYKRSGTRIELHEFTLKHEPRALQCCTRRTILRLNRLPLSDPRYSEEVPVQPALLCNTASTAFHVHYT